MWDHPNCDECCTPDMRIDVSGVNQWTVDIKSRSGPGLTVEKLRTRAELQKENEQLKFKLERAEPAGMKLPQQFEEKASAKETKFQQQPFVYRWPPHGGVPHCKATTKEGYQCSKNQKHGPFCKMHAKIRAGERLAETHVAAAGWLETNQSVEDLSGSGRGGDKKKLYRIGEVAAAAGGYKFDCCV